MKLLPCPNGTNRSPSCVLTSLRLSCRRPPCLSPLRQRTKVKLNLGSLQHDRTLEQDSSPDQLFGVVVTEPGGLLGSVATVMVSDVHSNRSLCQNVPFLETLKNILGGINQFQTEPYLGLRTVRKIPKDDRRKLLSYSGAVSCTKRGSVFVVGLHMG